MDGNQDGLADLQEYIDTGLGFGIHPHVVTSLQPRSAKVRIASVALDQHLLDTTRVTPFFTSVSCERVEISEVTKAETLDTGHQGCFDIVVVRLLHTHLADNKWDVAFRNLVALLRPGGWLQFVDFDPVTARIAGLKPGSPDGILRDILQRFSESVTASKVGSTHRVSTTLRTCGLIEQDSDIYPLVPEVAFTKLIARRAIDHLRSKGAVTDDDAAKLSSEVDMEIETARSLIWYDLWCHIAKKSELC